MRVLSSTSALPAGPVAEREPVAQARPNESKPKQDQFSQAPSAPPTSLDFAQMIEHSPEAKTLPPLRKALTDPLVPALDPATVPVPAQVLEMLQGAKRVLVIGHTPPDGDCIGSALGLGRALKALGKDVDVCVEGEFSKSFRNVDKHREIAQAETLAGGEWDLAVIVDVAGGRRLGEANDLLPGAGKVLVVDHHEPNAETAPETLKMKPGTPFHAWVVPECDAAALQVAAINANLAEANGGFSAEQWADCAMPVAVGTITDSGWMNYPGCEALSVQLLKHLITKSIPGGLETIEATLNVEVPAVARRFVDGATALSEADLTGLEPAEKAHIVNLFNDLVLKGQNVRTESVGKVGVVSVTDEAVDAAVLAGRMIDPEFNSEDIKPVYKSELTNQMLETHPVAVMVSEQPGGGFRMSFRSKEDGPALDLATCFGGGGHGRAAGAEVKGMNLAEIRTRIAVWSKAQG